MNQNNQLPACRFSQIKLFLKELKLGLLIAELGPVVVQTKLAHSHYLLPVIFNKAAEKK